MKNKIITAKYLLTLPGKIDILPTISINFNNSEDFKESPELFFNNLDDIFEFIDSLSKDNSIIRERISKTYFKDNISIGEESIEDRGSTLLDAYFIMFGTDYINKQNWSLFSMIFNLEMPRKHTKYMINNSNSTESVISSCIKNNVLDNKRIKKLYETFLDDNNNLINISFDYLCYNSKDLINVIIQYLFDLKSNAVIKRCENCRKLYIPKKLDAKYCDRISPQFENKTCKQAMDLINKNKALNDPIKRLYKNVYNTLYISYTHNKTKDSKNLFNEFVKANKIKDLEYKKGLIKVDEYESWLKSFYKRK